MDAKMIGNRIREVRQQRGLTQADLAQQVNMSLKHISAVIFKTATVVKFARTCE